MSLAGDIGDAAVAGIRGLGLTLSDSTALDSDSVFRRKFPALPAGTDPPAVIVVVGEDGRTEPLATLQKHKRWALSVVIVTAGGTQLVDDETVRTWRESIDDLFYNDQLDTFAGVDGFSECDSTGRTPFDVTALSKDLNYSILNYEVAVVEYTEPPEVPRVYTTLYTRITQAGAVQTQIAGLTVTTVDPTNITVEGAALSELGPEVNDLVRKSDGTEWRVTLVGSPSGNVWPLTVEAEE